jgi:U3 small nucleolar RNA-associated protein 11
MLKNIKKYIPKRKYRERSQLESRKKLGLLEKKTDYKTRAEDFHQKEKRYKKLKEEARLKNPEEFYFKMVNSKTVEGEHIKQREEIALEERLGHHNKLLNLVNMKRSLQDREKEKLFTDLQLLDHGNNNESTHQIFFESVGECLKFNAAEYFDTDVKLISNKTNRLRTSQLDKIKLTDDENEIKKMNTYKKNQYSKLSQKIKNSETLKKISNTLDLQKHILVLIRLIFRKMGKKRK